uniref:Uncharacterized protein n=1 Tax=Spironucleus salmonicida TaxID=348837 RepID=V6M3I3_9EUKA|eukprot:EST47849.1 Hypothetical protein SS50377_12040 [Spironucleus salmonicida]
MLNSFLWGLILVVWAALALHICAVFASSRQFLNEFSYRKRTNLLIQMARERQTTLRIAQRALRCENTCDIIQRNIVILGQNQKALAANARKRAFLE